MNLYNEPFPRAILHVDGDSFFVACELTKRPELKGQPVVTGSEKGIASAMSKEAKQCGVTRGMPIGLMKQVCPHVVLIESDFELYHHYSRRMNEIIKRYTEKIEPYSIDECFVDITDLNEKYNMSYHELAERIKRDLEGELGITFSVGVSTTKTLAKIASHVAKSAGITFIAPFEYTHYLGRCAIEDVWGIGKRTAIKLKGWGIHTALDLTAKEERWLARHFSKPLRETWSELRGVAQFEIQPRNHREYLSMSKTQSLKKTTTDKELLFSELSRNVERVCRNLRARKMYAKKFSLFLKTKDFNYVVSDFEMPYAVAHPGEVMSYLRQHFNTLFVSGVLYRATGVTVSQLVNHPEATLNLFNERETVTGFDRLYQAIDAANAKCGRGSLILGSSMKSVRQRLGEKVSRKARLNIPSLGFVY